MPLENPNPVVYEVAKIERKETLNEEERDEIDSLEVFGEFGIYWIKRAMNQDQIQCC